MRLKKLKKQIKNQNTIYYYIDYCTGSWGGVLKNQLTTTNLEEAIDYWKKHSKLSNVIDGPYWTFYYRVKVKDCWHSGSLDIKTAQQLLNYIKEKIMNRLELWRDPESGFMELRLNDKQIGDEYSTYSQYNAVSEALKTLGVKHRARIVEKYFDDTTCTWSKINETS